MTKKIEDICKELQNKDKKVQLIYAFNGTGKTRLSVEFKKMITGDSDENDYNKKIIYYNAFTEDLFQWKNDSVDSKIIITPNEFTNWIFNVQGYENKIINYFQQCINTKLNPRFDEKYSEITFPLNNSNENIKISKGEESNLLWSIFYITLSEIMEMLKETDDNRDTDKYNDLEYIFIDDPVTSLDDNHIIQVAFDIAQLIKNSPDNLKYIVTTHNQTFYNVIHNELNKKDCYLLLKNENGEYTLLEKKGDSNTAFSYHHHIKNDINYAIENNKLEKYHYTLLRNLYEKTANFLGINKWSNLLPENKENYYNRIINFASHSTLSSDNMCELTEKEKQEIITLFNHLIDKYNFKKDS